MNEDCSSGVERVELTTTREESKVKSIQVGTAVGAVSGCRDGETMGCMLG